MPTLNKIMDFRASVEKVVAMLTERGLAVTQRGTRAFVRYDPRNGNPISINIPMIPDTADDALIAAIRGFIDHECAHILFTDSVVFTDRLREAVKADRKRAGRLKNLWNIVEDVRIERAIQRRFPGSAQHIRDTWEWIYETQITGLLKDADSPDKLTALLLPTILHAMSGKLPAQDFMARHALWDRVTDLMTILEPFRASMEAEIESTEAAFGLAEEILRAFEAVRKPAPKAEPRPDRDDSEEEPEDKPEPDEESESEEDKPEPDEESESEEDKPEPDEESESEEGEEADDSEPEASDEDKPESGEEAEGEEPEVPEDESEGEGDPKGEPDEEEVDPLDDLPMEGEGEGEEVDPLGGDEPDPEEELIDGDREEWDGSPVDGTGKDAPSLALPDAEPEEPEDEPEEETEDKSDVLDEVKDMEELLAEGIEREVHAEISARDYLPFTLDFDDWMIADPKGPVGQAIAERQVEVMENTVMRMVGQMGAQMRRLFAQRDLVVNYGGQRSGRLHSAALHRLASGDHRIFTRREEHNAEDSAVTLLVDCSGSMSGTKIDIALEAAYAFSQTLDRIGIRHEVLGFTCNPDMGWLWGATGKEMKEEQARMGREFSRVEPIRMLIFKAFDESFRRARIRFGAMRHATSATRQAPTALDQNIDGESILYAAGRLLAQRQQRKVLIVLSDGAPRAAFGDARHIREHAKIAVETCEQRGVETLGIGIQDASVKRYYKKHLVLNSVQALPTTVMRELGKILLR